MIEKTKRRIDFMSLIEKLDISPTMYKNATEKYKNLGMYLEENGLEADIYPQGSFNLGTVVRPYSEMQDKNYDLDFICHIHKLKSDCTPKEIKSEVGDLLSSSGIYSNKLQPECDKCWTLEYSEIDSIGFNMDIVPAISENENTINELQKMSFQPQYAFYAIAITHKDDENYKWMTSNPKGYKKWFDKINTPFLGFNRFERLEKIFTANKNIYSSVEDIPSEIERSSLQRVIQILKRHRDVYFSKRKKEKHKPISTIITTIVAKIAEDVPYQLDVIELLDYITNEITIYSNKLILSEIDFMSKYKNRNIIKKINNEWQMPNPANDKDNLVDSWNIDSNNAKYFFEWITAVKEDFVFSFDKEDKLFFSTLENSLGSYFVRKHINASDYEKKTPTNITYPAKPWRK